MFEKILTMKADPGDSSPRLALSRSCCGCVKGEVFRLDHWDYHSLLLSLSLTAHFAFGIAKTVKNCCLSIRRRRI